MSANQPRASGLCAVCMVVLIYGVGFLMARFGSMNSEFPVEFLLLLPLWSAAHILALVALFTRSKRNRRLGFLALVLLWGPYGALLLLDS